MPWSRSPDRTGSIWSGPSSGAEGTLALITQATLRTEPIPEFQAVVVLLFDRLSDASEAVPLCLEARPVACELFDWRTLSLARDADPAYREQLVEQAEGAVVVAFEGDSGSEVRSQSRELAGRMRRLRSLAGEPALIEGQGEGERWLKLREAVHPAMMRLRGPSRPVAPVERLRVPPIGLARPRRSGPDLDERLGRRLDPRRPRPPSVRFTSVPFSNWQIPPTAIGSGRWPSSSARWPSTLGGTVAAGLDAGRIATFRRMQRELFNAHRELKYAFDPQNLLNPGKVVGDETTAPGLSLRAVPGPCAGAATRLGDRSRLVDASLAGTEPGRARRRVQQLRRLPVAGADTPDVPELPRLTFRDRHAPRPGPPAPRDRRRTARPEALGVRGVQGPRRPLRPLPPLRVRVSGRGGHLLLDDRGQGRSRCHARPGARRLDALADRRLVCLGEPVPVPVQRLDGQPLRPLGA